MLLPDVNFLVRSFNRVDPDYAFFRSYLKGVLTGRDRMALSELVLSGFIRVVTIRRKDGRGLFSENPIPMSEALAFINAIRSSSAVEVVSPGPRHWDIFADLCVNATTPIYGNLVPDAYHAALAIESGCEWLTADRGFRRFPGLRWRLLPDDQLFTNPT